MYKKSLFDLNDFGSVNLTPHDKWGPRHCIYIRTVSSFLLFLFCWTGVNWFIGHLGRATSPLPSISAQTCQEGIECIKARVAKVLLSNLYTVVKGQWNMHYLRTNWLENKLIISIRIFAFVPILFLCVVGKMANTNQPKKFRQLWNCITDQVILPY